MRNDKHKKRVQIHTKSEYRYTLKKRYIYFPKKGLESKPFSTYLNFR